jgi:hypothetical protein
MIFPGIKQCQGRLCGLTLTVADEGVLLEAAVCRKRRRQVPGQQFVDTILGDLRSKISRRICSNFGLPNTFERTPRASYTLRSCSAYLSIWSDHSAIATGQSMDHAFQPKLA